MTRGSWVANTKVTPVSRFSFCMMYFRKPPRKTWVVHGEPLAGYALRDALRALLGWQAEVPELGAVQPLA